ncbi:MAG: hypothetical protein ONB48_09995 [candidate division KSB1 bacterium]|nr:hypothetical protein [candidate division KSB1 bacterium]MDZ7273818.1 hypothetical protein [candidate division KSB1 bacterium]MDZ7285974.1 hypothetical protein [candidate division KSB1 bacterium]MDZ7299006.1 hypothetical protein [candidate division KSB1 bacterium]MDZ7309205.1 hypothetical protein [candidate division KSB1 bacterium]
MPKTSADQLIGREIETRCGKCKTDTLHTIIKVKKDGSIARVMCNDCKSEHIYRDKSAAAKDSVKKTAPRATRRKKDYDSLMAEISENDVKDYTSADDFTETKAIRHRSFGIGVITKIHNNTRIEVLFKDGPRLLGQNINMADLESTMADA